MKIRTLQVLAYIKEHFADTGRAPTCREIAAGVGLASSSAAQHHVLKLEAMGLIERAPGLARAIRVLDDGQNTRSDAGI